MAFKIVAIIDDSLSLGSVLMTKGVKAISIETIDQPPVLKAAELPYRKVTYHELNTKSKNLPRFYHPSSKPAIQLIYEAFKDQSTFTFKEGMLKTAELGFSPSSINNIITRLVKKGLIEKISNGKYKIIKNTSVEFPQKQSA